MNERIQLNREIYNLEIALEELRDRADEEQRFTHTKHWQTYWMAAMDPLEIQLDAKKALLKRIETVGR